MNYFPMAYLMQHALLMKSPTYSFACRGLPMAKEARGVAMAIDMSMETVRIFSCQTHRVVPMRFILAEMAFILSGRSDLAVMASYNKQMVNYSDDKVTLPGSYGVRLSAQFPRLVERLVADPYTRQACAAIFREDDCLSDRTHIPCNVFLQFLGRPPLLDLHVTSRSSDFATGFSIDTVHWQILHVLMANELTLQLHQQIVPNVIHYNIASLHIYEKDLAAIEQWRCPDYSKSSWEIEFALPLLEVIRNCQTKFRENLTVRELGALLGVRESSMLVLEMLQDLFLKYRNKLER